MPIRTYGLPSFGAQGTFPAMGNTPNLLSSVDEYYIANPWFYNYRNVGDPKLQAFVYHAVLRFDLGVGDIPAGDVIDSVTLRLHAIAQNTRAFTAQFAMLPGGGSRYPEEKYESWPVSDAAWWQLAAAECPDPAVACSLPAARQPSFKMQVGNAGPGFLMSWNYADDVAVFVDINRNAPAGTTLAGAGEQATFGISGQLSNVELIIGKVGSPAGYAFVRVYKRTSSVYPFWTPVATSNLVAISSLGAGPQVQLFPFYGPNSISVSAGETFAFVLFSDTAPSFGDYLRLHGKGVPGGSTSDGPVTAGQGAAFSATAYGLHVDVPAMFELLAPTVPRTPPHGSTISKAMPPFYNGAWAEITGLESLLQEWVDSPAYLASHGLATGWMIGTPDAPQAISLRQFDDAELVVEHHTPTFVAAAGSTSVTWAASARATIDRWISAVPRAYRRVAAAVACAVRTVASSGVEARVSASGRTSGARVAGAPRTSARVSATIRIDD